jgi:hypothetical protein
MRATFASLLITGILMVPHAAYGFTLEELKRYDKNGDGKLKGKEYDIYILHKKDPILARYDTNAKGYLSDAEYARMMADMARYRGGRVPGIEETLTPAEIFARGKDAADAASAGIALEDLAEEPKTDPDACHPNQSVYVRQDRLDTYLYGITPRSKAKGASVSYTDDSAAAERTLAVKGMVAIVPWRDPCIRRPAGHATDAAFLSAYAIAPWVAADGKINDPIKTNEKSDLKIGLDTQFAISGGTLFNYQAIIFSPYYQTDFRGEARVAGITGIWQPYQYAIRLGGSPTLFSEFLDWYWQFQGEVDIKHVDNVGFTDLQLGHYAWIGGTARLHLFLFPTSDLVPEFLRNRLHATGTFQAYWDAYGSGEIWKYSVGLAYNITPDGSTSVSIEYERGTNKDTLELVKQYMVKLNYKY